MKKFILPVLSVCFFIACNSDYADAVEATYVKHGFSPKTITEIANSDNVYDYVGSLHADMLQVYQNNYDSINSLQHIIDNVSEIVAYNPDFATMGSYTTLPVSEIEGLIDDIDSPGDIIDDTGLTLSGKAKINDFTEMMDDFETTPYSTVNKSIKLFEMTVINDIILTAADKQVILSVTSIARHSLAATYPKKRSWSSTKSGIIASVAAVTPPQAVTLSVTVNMGTE